MQDDQPIASGFASKRIRQVGLLVALTAAILCGWMSAGPISDASAWNYNQYFCRAAWVTPYGQNGDRCYSGWTAPLLHVHGKGFHHTGCVSASQGATLVHSWVCSPANVWAQVNLDGSRQLQGVVRNNNQNHANQVDGNMFW